jgi:mannose/fructose-specific phosphotransferase system component IIA
MKNRDFYHITGVNFPLFIDIAVSRNSYSLRDIGEKIIKNGKKSIVFVNEKFMTD